MAKRPTPIVVVTGSRASENVSVAMRALEAGAVAVLEKPAGSTHDDYEIMAERLCTKLVVMSQVKVIRQRRFVPKPRPAEPVRTEPRPPANRALPLALGIASSTGGPNALLHLLNGLGPEFPLPILLVQHMSANFLEGFAILLRGICALRVVVLQGAEKPRPGVIYMACADRHLRWEGGSVRPAEGALVSSQRPSATVMFESLARELGEASIGVVLTGLGDDGSAGLLALRNRGGYTLAESRATAVVYGMPGTAVLIGAVCESLPIGAIAPRIRSLVTERQELL